MPAPCTIALRDAAATARAGALIARCVTGGMFITLDGELGAGKTTLVRGLLRAAGVEGPVKSPTYDLVEHYSLSSIYFYHIDLYRFTDASEWDDAGLAECFGAAAVVLLEWPARAATRLPPPDLALALRIDAGGSGRMLSWRARGASGERCAAALSAGVPDA